MSKKTKNTFEDIVLHSALYEKKVLSDIDIESIDEYIKTENYEVFCSRKTSMAYAALH
jgi:hypothetical protein